MYRPLHNRYQSQSSHNEAAFLKSCLRIFSSYPEPIDSIEFIRIAAARGIYTHIPDLSIDALSKRLERLPEVLIDQLGIKFSSSINKSRTRSYKLQEPISSANGKVDVYYRVLSPDSMNLIRAIYNEVCAGKPVEKVIPQGLSRFKAVDKKVQPIAENELIARISFLAPLLFHVSVGYKDTSYSRTALATEYLNGVLNESDLHLTDFADYYADGDLESLVLAISNDMKSTINSAAKRLKAMNGAVHRSKDLKVVAVS